MRALLLTLLLPMQIALGGEPPPLPDDHVALIRAGRIADAYAAGERDLAQFDANKPGDANARCALLDRLARVQLFDYADPDAVRQERVLDAARACHEALPADARRDAQIAWLQLRLAAFKAVRGRMAEVKAQAQTAEETFLRDPALLIAADRAGAYHALASLATSRGDFATAVTRYSDAIAANGDRNAFARAQRATMQIPLAAVIERTGRNDDAIEAGKLAVRWNGESYGEHSLAMAGALGALAQAEFFGGRYADALDHAERGIREARAQDVHGRRTLSFLLLTLGNTLRVTGELQRARAALTETLAIERADAVPNVGALAAHLNQLGYVDELIDGCGVAMPRYREALELGEKQFGTDNVRIAVALVNIGGCELKLRNYDAAQAIFEREGHLQETAYGLHHPAVARSRFNLADLALRKHDYAGAQAHLRDALALLPSEAGSRATTSIAAHRALAQALHGIGRDDEAFAEAVIAETARQQLLRRTGANLGEAHALAFKDSLTGALDLALALAARHPEHGHAATAWQLQIGARQLVTRLVTARLQAVRHDADADSEKTWLAWESASRAYGDAVLAHESGKVDTAALRQRSQALDEAERALAHRIGASAQTLSAAPLDVAALQAALPPAGALVAYAIGAAEPWDDAQPSAERRLYAFDIAPGGEPTLRDLGPAAAANAAINDWTAALRDPASDDAARATSGERVRHAIWDPLAMPASVRRVFIVPEGDVHRVAWMALPLAQGLWAESGLVANLLGGERELVERRVDPVNAERLLLVGAPPLDANGTTADPACPRGADDLRGAEQELSALRSMWHTLDAHAPLRVLAGRDATKDAVRTEAARSRTLHFATHAFAGDSPCLADLLATRSVHLAPAHAGNARDLNGLVLAPARSHAGASDSGILTAADIAALKLDGVDGVTLAACDTGLGPVLADEGVFGLARAFRVAGARSVVMSLWQIDDAATADLVQRFYRARFAAHDDVATALATAARETLAARRARGESTHPYYWAAFVASGDAQSRAH